MKYADKMEFSNIQLYEVGDVHTENMILKAIRAGAKEVVVCPTAVGIANRMIKPEDGINVNCAVAYPSGAFLTFQKVQEIEDMLEEDVHIDAFYAVMHVGMYLSGHIEETRQDILQVVAAAGDIPVKIVTEISVLSDDQMKEIADMCAQAGAAGVVISSDFKPYDIPEPTIQQLKTFVAAADGRFEVIGAGAVTAKERFLDMIEAGAARVNTAAGFEILTALSR